MGFRATPSPAELRSDGYSDMVCIGSDLGWISFGAATALFKASELYDLLPTWIDSLKSPKIRACTELEHKGVGTNDTLLRIVQRQEVPLQALELSAHDLVSLHRCPDHLRT